MIKPVTFWQRALVYFICWTFNIQPLLANVIVDNSQHNTSVNRAGNGVEVVNIATPNANGLSHNQYQQFNVDPSGLILNNSTAQVAQSQLGGYLQNNPNLHGQAATVILNEVTGASRSQLQGYTEVFGQGAPVILTNPYGITCNGCGFINTPRVTLSTGNPLIENGNVTGFDVSQGSVSIEGLGLDATHQSYFDIITRTAQLNADIHANDLSIVTGKNRVSYQSNQVTATTADDKEAAPELAIDSSNLGGMYAGRIALVATDAGVGVNVGNLSASQGDIRISADGQITLGKSSAQNNLTVSSQSGVTLKGSQYAGQTASLSGHRIHADSNTLAAGQNVSLTATDTVTLNQSLVEAGVDADGKQQAGGVVDVQANNLTLNAGNLIAGQQLTTAVDHITADQNSLIYGQKMALNQLSKLDNSGTVAAKDQLSVKGTDASLVGHGNMTASEITMDSDRLTLDTHITAQTLAVQASQNLTTGEQSEVSATDKLTVTAGTLNQQGQLTTRGDMDINAADAILKGDVAAQDIQVKAQHLTQESGTLQAGQTLHITGDTVTLSGGSAGKNSVGIDAGQLTLNGTLQSGGDTHLTVVNDMQTREQSQLVTQGSLQATVGTLTQRGKMQSGEDVTLTGHTLKNEGLVSAVGNTHLTAQAQLTNRGTVTSGQQLTTNAGAVTSSGELSAQQKVAMTVAGQLDNQTNGLISGQVTTVQAGSVNNAGQLQSLTDLGLTADALNNSGTLAALSDTTLNVTHDLTNRGAVSAGHDVRLLTDNLTNSGQVIANDNLLIAKDLNQTRNTSLNNTGGSLDAGSGSLTIATQGDLQVSAGQHLFAGKDLTVTAATLNNSGEIAAQNKTRLTLDGVTTGQPVLTNQTGGLISGQSTSIDAQSVANHGQLQALGDLGLTATSLANSGTLTALNTTLAVHDHLLNTGTVSAVENISLLADQVDNQGRVSAGTHLLIAADQDNKRSDSLNNAGRVETRNGDIEIVTDAMTQQSSGHMIAGHDFRLDGNQLDNGGELAATGKTDLLLHQQLLNQQSGLISGQVTAITAQSVNNQGQLQSLSDLGLTAESFGNSGVLAALDNTSLHISHDLTSSGSILAGHQIVLNAEQLDNRGRISAGDAAIATPATGQDDSLIVTADTLTNSGELLARGRNQLTLNMQLTNQTDGLISGQTTTVNAQSVTNHGQLQSLTDLGLTADALANSGTLAALSDMTLKVAHQLSNSGAVSASHDVSLLTDNLTNSGKVFAGNNLLIAKDSGQTRTTTFNNTDGSLTAKAGHLTIATHGDVVVSAGQHLTAGQNVTLQASSLTNDGEVSAQGKTALTLDNALTNHGLVSGQQTTLAAQSVTNTGQLQSLTDLGLTADALDNSGTLAALSDMTLNVAHQLSNTGAVLAGSNIHLNATKMENRGRVSAGDQALMTADQQAAGRTDASLSVSAITLTNSGELLAQGSNQLTLNTQLTNQTDGLISGQITTVNAPVVTNAGQLQSLTDLGLTADALNNSGTLAALSDMTLNVAHQLSNTGAVSADHDVSLLTDNLTNTGKVFAGNNLLIAKDSEQTRTTTFNNTDGSLTAKAGHLTIATHGDVVVSTGQHLTAGQNVTLQASSLTNDAEVSAQGKTALILDNTLTNHGLVSGQGTTVTAQSVNNTGQMQALTDLGLNADVLANSGTLGAGNNAVFNIIHTLTSNGNISAGNNASLLADQVNNQNKIYARNSVLIAKDSTQTRSSSLTNSGQIDAKHGSISIATHGDFTVGAGQHLSAGKDLTLVADALTNDGELSSQGITTIGVDGTLTNHTAGIISGQNTVLRAGATTNQGQLQALNDLNLTTGSLTNSGSLVALHDMTLNATGHVDNHSLFYAGHDGNLFSDSLTNYSDIVVGNDLLIARDSNKTRSRDLTNSSGSIESLGGNIGIYADTVLNKRTVLNIVNQTQDLRGAIPGGGGQTIYIREGSKYAPIVEIHSSHNDRTNWTFYRIVGGTNWTFEAYRDQQILQNASNVSRILSASDIVIDTNSLQNNTSQISGKNIFITADTLTNKGYEFQSYVTYFDYQIRNLHIRDIYPYDLRQVRRVDSGIIGTLQSSITARDNLTLNVQNRTNNSVIGINAAGAQPTQSARTARATQGPSGTQAGVHVTQNIPDAGQGSASIQNASDSAQSATTHSIELTSQGSDSGAAVQAGQTSTGSGLAAQSAPNLTSVARTTPQGKSATTVTLSNSSTVTAPTVNLPNQNRIPFPDYRLPTSPHGLFVFSDGPQSDYLIATNPAVTNLNDFLGSDYFKDQLNYDPERKEKFLGDAYYDTRTISQEIFEQTGKRYLNEDIGSDLAQMKQLIDSAAQEKTALNLKNGVALTDEQIARLSHDIIWYEPIEVNGQTVMAPKLYLSSASQDNISNGALLAGRNVNVTTGDFANSGAVAAREDLSIASRNGISNTHGTLSANDDLALIATGDIVNRSGVISGGNVQLKTTSGNVVNETLVNKTDYGNGFVHTEVGPESLIQSRTTLGVSAGKDIVSKGATIRAGEGTVLLAGGDVTFGAVERETQQSFLDGGTRQVIKDIVHLGSTVSSGGDLTIQAGNNFHATASDLSAQGTLILAAGHDITLDTAVDTAYRYSDGGGHTRQLSTTTNQGSNLSGRDVLLQSGNDTTLVNGGIQASGNVALNAKGDVNILAANDSRYEYSKSTHKKSFGRSKTTIHESLKETVRGSSIAAGGDITIKAQKYSNAKLANGHSDIQVVGSNLNAGDAINLSADGDVILSAQQYREYQYNQTIKKGFGGLSGSNRGNLDDATLLEGANTIAASHININSGKNIGVIASTVSAGGDVNMQALDEVLVTADNILRQTQQWDEKSSFLSGGHLMEMSSDREGMQSSTAQGSQIASHGNVNIQGGSVALVGSDVGAGENTVLKADTGHLDIRSAQNSLRKTSQHKQVSVDFPTFELLSHPESALQITDGQVRFRIGKATYDQVENQTTATTQTGSTILANNDVSLSATGDLTVTGSRIAADQDGSGAGDLSLAAENILIQEAKETEQTQSQEVHGKAEASLVVQHQAVEVAKAVKGLQQATQALKQAKQDYQQYKKQLASLKGTLETLQADYAAKKPGVMFEDIEELQDLVSDLKGDEAWYAAGIALAAENVTSKTTLLAKQSDAAVNSITSGAFGFDAGLHLDIDADKQNSQSQRVTSVGSQLSGQNVTIEAGHQTGQSATVQGSVIHADDTLAVSGNQVNLLASDEQSSNTNGSESAHVGASVTLFGANSGVNLDASYSRNESVSQSQTHTNSVLSADHIRITSDGDTDVNGADVAANEQLDMSVGGDLNVASVQNRYSSTNHGGSVSGGVGLSGGDVGKGGAVSGFDHAGNLQGVNSGVNLSNGRSHSRETMLTRITSGGDANITVGGNTDIKGATIATVNEDGSDTGRLHLETGTLSYTDLSNTRDTSSRNAGVSSSVSIGPDKDGATQIDASRNSSRYQYTNQSGYHKSKTLATVGQGELRIEDTHNSDDTERLNRDITSTTKDLYSVDRQQGNFDVTVDHRLLSEAGWKEIAEDIQRNKLAGKSLVDIALEDSVSLSNALEHVDVVQKELDVEMLVASRNGKSTVSLNNLNMATAAQKQQAINDYAVAYAQVFGISIESALVIAVDKSMGGAHYMGQNGSNIVINDAAMKNAQAYMRTLAHEVTHGLTAQGAVSDKGSSALNEEYSDLIGGYAEDNFAFALEHAGLGDLNTGDVNNHIGNGTVLTQNNWNTIKDVPVSQLDFEIVRDGGYKNFSQLVQSEPRLNEMTLGQMNALLDNVTYLMTYGDGVANSPAAASEKMAYVLEKLKQQGTDPKVIQFLKDNTSRMSDIIGPDREQYHALGRALINVTTMGVADMIRDPSTSERVRAIQAVWDNAFTAAGVPSAGIGLASLGADIAQLLGKKGVALLSKDEFIATAKAWDVDITQASKQEMDGLYQEYAQASGKLDTVISPEMESKILYGQRATNSKGNPTNRLIGAHSGNISDETPNFAVETISINSDGTRNVKLITQFDDGNVSKIKNSTLFPESWSDGEILSAVQQTGRSQPLATRASDGATLYQSEVNGVKIEVIKVGNKVTAGYPCGNNCTDVSTF
ncbi:hemagglutinin repeat-containing protein [Vibrio rhizosphaerae]|uniref:two-partner secretion domain-containing protein n=1 Tax=Vibrio rhizosphaerae TaxID=398736 RepID=UPI00068CC313|nr:hemagglutinin repeat-containing protein [Vibrio rhizosphaerae]